VVVAALADQLGVASAEEMAEGIVRIAVAQMANAIREISIERGYDPSEFVLFPFGGAGPMHAAQIAEEIGMGEILVPILPGNLSALGLLASDQRHERVQTFMTRLSTLDRATFSAAIGERPMISGGRSSPAIVYERERLPVDAMFEGPAIIEEEGATTVVPPGWRGHRDASGNLRLSANP